VISHIFSGPRSPIGLPHGRRPLTGCSGRRWVTGNPSSRQTMVSGIGQACNYVGHARPAAIADVPVRRVLAIYPPVPRSLRCGARAAAGLASSATPTLGEVIQLSTPAPSSMGSGLAGTAVAFCGRPRRVPSRRKSASRTSLGQLITIRWVAGRERIPL
jgi:hypothetical protein